MLTVGSQINGKGILLTKPYQDKICYGQKWVDSQ